jgi:aldehyde:ferredoxin oxidoreductase
MYQGGYTGKILRFKPTGQTANEEELPPKIAQGFIGGAEFENKDLFDEFKADSGPLATDHPLNFSPGPFSCTTIPYVSQIAVGVELPLTHTVVLALQGGYFPVELEYAENDARGIKAQGKHSKPGR